MLTKSNKYYWDADAVREPMTPLSINNIGRLRRGVSPSSFAPISSPHQLGGKTAGDPELGRNIRSVWDITTQPYPEAHFAVFPEAIPEKCIKAVTKEGDLVLDPFMGSGTTLWMAKKLNRRAVGYDISEEYCQLALDRNRQMAMI